MLRYDYVREIDPETSNFVFEIIDRHNGKRIAVMYDIHYVEMVLDLLNHR